jgi:hypothetical protein
LATKRVKIHYRRLLRQDGTFPVDKSLQDRVATAMDTTKPDGSRVREKAKYRIASVPGNEGSQRLLNTYHAEDSLVFGTVCLTSPGELQALIRVTDASGSHPNLADVMAQLEIAEAAAPAGHEYVHGMTYWTIIGDHFYQIQHVSMQAKAMEEYLTWLLRDTATISATEAVMLQWKFDRAQVGDDELESIQIGGLMPESIHEPAVPIGKETIGVQDVETRESLGERVAATFAKARQVIVDLIGEVETDKIIDAMPAEASLDVRVNIGFKAKKRKLKREVMSNLEAGLRNIADGEIVAKGRNGEVRGNDARLSMDMNVRRISETSGLLDPEDALRQILEVHRRFLHDSKID